MKFDDFKILLDGIRFAKSQLPRIRDVDTDVIFIEITLDIGKVDMKLNIPFRKRFNRGSVIGWELDVSKETIIKLYEDYSPDVQPKEVMREEFPNTSLSHDKMWNNRGYKFEK